MSHSKPIYIIEKQSVCINAGSTDLQDIIERADRIALETGQDQMILKAIKMVSVHTSLVNLDDQPKKKKDKQ